MVIDKLVAERGMDEELLRGDSDEELLRSSNISISISYHRFGVCGLPSIGLHNVLQCLSTQASFSIQVSAFCLESYDIRIKVVTQPVGAWF